MLSLVQIVVPAESAWESGNIGKNHLTASRFGNAGTACAVALVRMAGLSSWIVVVVATVGTK